MSNAGLIFIIRANHFISKLTYAQLVVLLDLVRKRKQKMDKALSKHDCKR